MNYLTTLLTLATLLSTQAATSSLVGGVRVSTDTTGTNTIAANIVITNLNSGASRTALMARDVQVTNAVKVLSLTGNRVVGIGTDKALTNTTVSIAALEALSTAGTNNWINSGTTNSTLAGTAYPWAVEVTNHVNVGASGEAGVILFTSTNGTYTASISLLADGTLVVTNNGVLVATVALSSGYDGSTNKFLSAAGTYLTVNGTIWTNISGSVQIIGSANFTVSDSSGAITGASLATSNGTDNGNYYPSLIELTSPNAEGGLNAIAGQSSDVDFKFQLYNNAGGGTNYVLFAPKVVDNSTPFYFDTFTNHTAGNLVEFSNGGGFTSGLTYNGAWNSFAYLASSGADSAQYTPFQMQVVSITGGSNNIVYADPTRFRLLNNLAPNGFDWVNLQPYTGDSPTNSAFAFRPTETWTGTNDIFEVNNSFNNKSFGVTATGIHTAVPTSATNALPFRVGQIATGAGLVTVTTNYLQIDINGVAYKVGLVQ